MAPINERKVHIRTFGCQMNVYDSERIAEALGAHGFAETASAAEADLVVLNTCHIREKAAEKVYSELGLLREMKDEWAGEGRTKTIAVAGCVAQAEGGEIVRRAPAVDVVVGPQSYHRLPDLLARVARGERQVVETEFPDDDKFAHLPKRSPARTGAAYLTVQEGCDKFCTFCVVPYTRGAEISRPVGDVVAEARGIVEGGAREIVLLGQNVNGYHGKGPDGADWSLARLMAALAQVEGLERIRYTTSHPRDMGADLIEAHATNPKLMPFLHLPFQSGADRILAAMNRKHTAAEYVALIARIRAARSDIALSTDIIVGFPGETEDEFEATLQMVERVRFAHAYSFKYSARPGTPAASLEAQIPEPVKAERLQRLQECLSRQSTRFNASFVGKTLPVLFDRSGRRNGQLVGRSPYLQSVHADADTSLLGRIVNVEISAAGPNSLAGVIRAI